MSEVPSQFTNGGGFISYVRSELECPVCLSLMIGEERQPRLCLNGHHCCLSCTSRVSCCPICRTQGPWSRCLAMEKIGSWLFEKNFVKLPTPVYFPSDEDNSNPPPRYFFERGLQILDEILLLEESSR